MRRAALGVAAALALFGCSKKEPVVLDDPKPAASVSEAIRLITMLENVGDEGSTNAIVRVLDVRGMDARRFRQELQSMPGREVHLWMPGERTWVLAGRIATNRVSLAEAMACFAADTNCTSSIADVFASYVGEREDIMPAFAAALEGEVLPEWFVREGVKALSWIDTDDVDADILRGVSDNVRSMQIVRRELLKGNMLAAKAKDKKGEEAAAATWARVALRNPHDPMLLERLENLNRNAKGFLAVGKVLQAMKCYETIILVQPTNFAAVHNFGMCLKKIGKLDLAEKVLDRAKMLRKMKEGDMAR